MESVDVAITRSQFFNFKISNFHFGKYPPYPHPPRPASTQSHNSQEIMHLSGLKTWFQRYIHIFFSRFRI